MKRKKQRGRKTRASVLIGIVLILAIAVLGTLWAVRIVPTAIYARYVIVLLFGGAMVYTLTAECERQEEQDKKTEEEKR